MLGAIIAGERLGDGDLVGLDAAVAQGGELPRVALAIEHRIENGQAGEASDIADHMMQAGFICVSVFCRRCT
jgi:hypothetical protein